MKKLTLLLASLAVATVANAGTKVLYNQDFESVTNPADVGWTYGGESMTIQSDNWGSFLELYQGQTNGRNAQLKWGEIYGDNASNLEDGKYTIVFDYSPAVAPSNQYNSGITVLTNLTPPANQPFLGRWTYLKDADGNNIEDLSLYQGYLFDLTQVQRETEETGSIQFKVNNNADDLIVMSGSDWYTITLDVDVNARTVDYSITTLQGASVTGGSRTVPATECDGTDISMYATGLWVMVARYQTKFLFDNIKVSCESATDVANDPSVALTGIGVDADENLNLNIRKYTITYLEGEILHVKGTDGVEETISYMDTDGIYLYYTTKSGQLEAWTTCGSAESNHVIVEVDCSPYALPETTANISAVEEGYGKTYTLTVSNTDVALQPKLFIHYSFVGQNGETLAAEDQGSGVQVTVTQPGTLTLTTAAFGYQSTTSTVQNDLEFEVKYVVDLARMTTEDITGKGFKKDEDLNSGNTSGEQNWTARKRLYYYDVATAHPDEETGETVYDAVYPFGFIAEDNTTNVINRYIISGDDLTADMSASLFEHLTIWDGLQAKMLYRIGLIQDATKNNYNKVIAKDLNENDFVMFNTIDNYGGDSNHPICSNDDEYYAQLEGSNTVTSPSLIDPDAVFGNKSNALSKTKDEETGTWNVVFPLYRIQTALTKVTAFSPKGSSSIDDVIVLPQENNDPYYYTIDGLRVLEPNRTGLYIHQGKKVYIVK